MDDGSGGSLKITAAELAAMLSGAVGAELIGDGSVALAGVGALDAAGPGDLSFVRSSLYAEAARVSKAGALLVSRSVEFGQGGPPACAVIVVDDADAALELILAGVRERRLGSDPTGVHPGAVVDASAVLGEGVFVGPGAVIEQGAVIGAGTKVLANTFVGAGCVVGARCELGPNATIGSDGFGYRVDEATGVRTRLPHAGVVRLGDDVHVGANSAIDRGKLADTVIGRGTKIDNLVQVGHNCMIGEDCVLCGLVGIAGSVTVGDRVVMAGQVGVADNLTIASDVILMAQAGVTRSVDAPGAYVGSPARPRAEFAGEVAAVRRLVRDRKKQRRATESGDGDAG